MISLELATTSATKNFLAEKNKHNNKNHINVMEQNPASTSDNPPNSTPAPPEIAIHPDISENKSTNKHNNLDISKKLSIRLKNLLPSTSGNRGSYTNTKPPVDSINYSSPISEGSPPLTKRKSYSGQKSNNLTTDSKSFDFPNTPFRTPSPSKSFTIAGISSMDSQNLDTLLSPEGSNTPSRRAKPLPVQPSTTSSSHFSTGSEALKLEDLDWLNDTSRSGIHATENGQVKNPYDASGLQRTPTNENTLKIQTQDLNRHTLDSDPSYINPDSAQDVNPLHLDEVINSMSSEPTTFHESEEPAKQDGETRINSVDIESLSNNVNYSDLDANQKRKNIEFHIYFPTLPLDDILLEDYHCALQRDILISGRLYLTAERVCFHSNLFGWVTHTIIPFKDIISIQKRSTAFVIPNAIQIATLDNKYFFTSFMSRDATYAKLYEYWNRQCPTRAIEPVKPESSSNSKSQTSDKNANDASADGSDSGANTKCACLKPGGKGHTGTIYIDTVVEMNIKDVYELLFGDDITFLKSSIVKSEGYDIEINPWKTDNGNPKREYKYIKPLYASMGPKSTQCLITEEVINKDFEDYVTVNTRTQNPDVPSGSCFTVATNFCLMVHRTNQTRMVQYGCMEWSKSSWLKGVIEAATKEGVTRSATLSKETLDSYLADHPELKALPEGNDDTLNNNADADNANAVNPYARVNDGDNSILTILTDQLTSLRPYSVHILMALISIILINILIFWRSPSTSNPLPSNFPSPSHSIRPELPRLLFPQKHYKSPNYWQEVQRLKQELASLKKQMGNIENLLERFEGQHY